MPTAAAIGLGITSLVGAGVGAHSASKARKASSSAADKAASATQAGTSQAREDINRIFPQAQQASQQGFQGALDVFGQSLPAQTDVFQQGNVGAQQAILSGMPQIQNAILGGNVDYSQMQPFQVQTPDLGFFQQTLPQIKQQQNQANADFNASFQDRFVPPSAQPVRQDFNLNNITPSGYGDIFGNRFSIV